jgi:hypothetical protein
MKKAIKYFAFIAPLLTAVSCELITDNTNQSVAEKLEGRWQVEESPIDFKSAKDAYIVYIDIYQVDSNTIAIDNFLDLNAGSVSATISGSILTIPTQELSGGWTVYGTGVISNNYQTITWNYYVDEGSGSWHQSNPVYTKADY